MTFFLSVPVFLPLSLLFSLSLLYLPYSIGENRLPWWLRGKEYACHCRRQVSDP